MGERPGPNLELEIKGGIFKNRRPYENGGVMMISGRSPIPPGYIVGLNTNSVIISQSENPQGSDNKLFERIIKQSGNAQDRSGLEKLGGGKGDGKHDRGMSLDLNGIVYWSKNKVPVSQKGRVVRLMLGKAGKINPEGVDIRRMT